MADGCGKKSGQNPDLIIVGAGSAGFSAAITAAEAGANVLLTGWGTIGGTCVNVGCVPSKFLIRAGQALYEARHAKRFAGIEGSAGLQDWAALRENKQCLVEDLRRKKYSDLLKDYPSITYREGRVRLVEGGVDIEGERVCAEKILITTGTRPHIPDLPGLVQTPYLDSTDALALDKLPKSLLVLGGGFIGCEMAQIFSRLGVEVTLVARSRLLPQAEPEIAEALRDYFQQEHIAVEQGLALDHVEKTADGIALTISRNGKQERLEAARLLLATGRQANSDDMGLEEMGVNMRDDGTIIVDVHMRTSHPAIYAAGDVTGRDQFVYMAAYGAKLAARNALAVGEAPQVYDNHIMPFVVFTDPQMAGVGLSEAQARAQGYEVKTSIAPLDVVPRALAALDMRGLIKLVADAKTDRLLGGQILAPEGADSIQTLAMALKYGMATQELSDMIFPYLTMVEGMKLAAQGFGKDVAKLSCCAG